MNVNPEVLRTLLDVGIGTITVILSFVMAGRRVLNAQRADAKESGRAEGILQTTLEMMKDKISSLEIKVTQISADLQAARDRPYPCSRLEDITRISTMLREVADRLERHEDRLAHNEHALQRLETQLASQSGIGRGRQAINHQDDESVIG